MANRTYTSQKDPAEGSREVVDRELKRQAQGSEDHGAEHKDWRTAGRPPRQTKEDRAKNVS